MIGCAKSAFRWIVACAAAACLVGFSAAQAYADEPLSVAGNHSVTDLPAIVLNDSNCAAMRDLPDNDELFAGYVESAFADSAATGSGITLEPQKVTRGDRLEDQERAVYDVIVARVKDIAAGKESSAVIPIPLADLGVQSSYTAEELGLDTIFDEQNPSEVSEAARAAVNGKFNVALMSILYTVLNDCPYELYWYDKTTGIAFEPPSISAVDNGSGGALVFAKPLAATFKMFVSGDYSVNGAIGTYEADKELTGAASKAVEKAQAIVDEHKAEGDFEKLHSYMETIARLTDYDYNAADTLDATGIYGNSWQVINVFDGDPSTKVVCEGYAKAFQYLCDMSTFADASIACNCVSGEMTGGTGWGPHMWNIVALGEKNYLVDVTNNDNFLESDEHTSHTPNDELFLAGAEGSVSEGYRIEWPDASGSANHWIYYAYDQELLYFFDEAELTLSQTSYLEDVAHAKDPDPVPVPTDAEVAKPVYNLISAIGKVSYDAKSKAAIDKARAAYNALTASQKALVKNYAALANAEARYASLKSEADKAAAEKEEAAKAAAAEKKAASITAITVNTAKVTKSAIAKAIKKAGGKAKYITKIALGTKVKKIAKGAFSALPKAKTLVVKTKKLKKSAMKNCLKSSKIKTVKVPKSKKKAYKKLFTKKIAGKKVTVK